MAAAHFGALDSLIPETTESVEEDNSDENQMPHPISTTVNYWSELPGGGD
jgi:hypothetical protein